MQPIRASVELRASVGDAVRGWSEFSAPPHPYPRRVDFEPLAGAESRVTVQLVIPASAHAAQRTLERHLAAFKGFVEQRASASRACRYANG